jgi:hypothetical protein
VIASERFLGAFVLSVVDQYANVASQFDASVYMSLVGPPIDRVYNMGRRGQLSGRVVSIDLLPDADYNLTIDNTAFAGGTTTVRTIDARVEGLFTLMIVCGTLAPTITPPISVRPADGTALAFGSVLSPSVIAAAEFDVPPTVLVLDVFGNRAKQSEAVMLQIAPMQGGSALIGSFLTRPDVAGTGEQEEDSASTLRVMNGIGVFEGIAMRLAGEGYSLKATSTMLRPAFSTSFTVHHAAAYRLVFIAQPPSATLVRQLFPTQPVIEARDAYGNRVSNSDIGITLQNLRPDQADNTRNMDLRGVTHRLAVAGQAAFPGLVVVVPNRNCRLLATSGMLISVQSEPFDVVGTSAPSSSPSVAPLPALLPVAVQLVFIVQVWRSPPLLRAVLAGSHSMHPLQSVARPLCSGAHDGHSWSSLCSRTRD